MDIKNKTAQDYRNVLGQPAYCRDPEDECRDEYSVYYWKVFNILPDVSVQFILVTRNDIVTSFKWKTSENSPLKFEQVLDCCPRHESEIKDMLLFNLDLFL